MATLPIHEDDVLRAIEKGEIVAFYQPQVSADGSRCVSFEALARWKHPYFGVLNPGQFIPQIAGNVDVIQLLSEEIMKCVFRDFRHSTDRRVAVNLDPVQFNSPRLHEKIESIAFDEKFPLNSLELEILETSFFENRDSAVRVLSRLRKLGVSVALDDFGTGFSSLSAMIELPLDKVKIDASFIQQCEQIKSASVIHAIVAVARSIGLKVTAEGVETPEQHRFLRIAGCHYLQGFLFSNALPPEKVDLFVSQLELRRFELRS